MSMNNEPVAIRYDFDGYGYQYMDSGSGSDWLTRVDGELLYTNPAKTLTDEEIKQIFQEQTGFFFDDNPADDLALMDFARAILKKANE